MRTIYKGTIFKSVSEENHKDSAVPEFVLLELLFPKLVPKGWEEGTVFATRKKRESQTQLLREDQWLLIRDITSLKQPYRGIFREIMTLLPLFPHSYLLLGVSTGQTNQRRRAHSPIFMLHVDQPSGREPVKKGGECMWRGNWHRHTVTIWKDVSRSV